MGKYNEHNFYHYGNQPYVQNLQVTTPTNTPNNNYQMYQSKSGLSTPIHTPSYEQTIHSIISGLNTEDTSLDSIYIYRYIGHYIYMVIFINFYLFFVNLLRIF